MRKTVIKYLITFILLLVYINRGVFVTPYEMENQGNDEINSIAEWIQQFITGKGNGIDEDGDLQTDTDCHSANVVHYDFTQQLTQEIEFGNLFAKNIAKNIFPDEESFLVQDFRPQIDQPPEII